MGNYCFTETLLVDITWCAYWRNLLFACANRVIHGYIHLIFMHRLDLNLIYLQTVLGTTLHYKTPGSNFRNRSGNIKRPMNAFMVWARTNRAKLSVDMPDASNAEISVRLGQVWASLSRDEKQKYYLEAERIKMRHRIDFPGKIFLID